MNLIRLEARGYNPTIGRFDRTDPVIEEQEQFSLYHYSFNNPVRFSDADGLMGESCCQKVIDFVAGATLRFIDNNSPVPTSLDGGGYRGIAYENGRKFGDGLSLLSGGVQLIAGGLGTLGAGGLELVTGGAATPIALPVGAAAIATAGNGVNTISKALGNLNSEGAKNSGGNQNTQSSNVGKRRENRIPDTGKPNSTATNPSGTTTKKYGPDGNVQKEFNKGHQGNKTPKNERNDHVHDHKPKPNRHPNDPQPTDRQPGRPPKKGELKRDFGL
ncbi:RHS repeat-associated core domain-containing protein [Emticicia sp. TH156]|uniref:RHS repeat-associated core domain-containing protein n=1 Tax=Emticicia sp. TH156 TaxID=2067454 RepID=UPI000C78E2B2|nr:RHS repeat-associated core domain-containing protein [Emticicia sp. TH156]PLK44197.1 hypothetical protein C0V77_10365 [Emticicia sp. TH156]